MKIEILRRIQQRARAMRRKSTEEEAILWDALRSRNLSGAKFRRQHTLGPYVADFYNHENKFVIEVDGDPHAGAEAREYDQLRTQYLESLGLRVLRFWNSEVANQLDTVLARIERELKPRT